MTLAAKGMKKQVRAAIQTMRILGPAVAAEAVQRTLRTTTT
jgi:hypothetical protein